MIRAYLIVLLTIATFNYVKAQNQSKKEKLLQLDELAKSETKKILNEGLNFIPYLYQGTNIDRIPVDDFEQYHQKIIFYWSAECRYCKKELDDLNKLIAQQPALQDSILIIMRVDKQNKEWSVQSNNEHYTLYKGEKKFLRLPVPLLFLSEKILEESSLKAAPHTLFLDKKQKIIYVKPGYFASKRGSQIKELNFEFLQWKIDQFLKTGIEG